MARIVRALCSGFFAVFHRIGATPFRMTEKECEKMIGAILVGLIETTKDLEMVRRAFQWWVANEDAMAREGTLQRELEASRQREEALRQRVKELGQLESYLFE